MADSYQTLLFAEPQILIAWAAGSNRPRISGDTSLLLQQNSPQRILAFGTWLAPEPARQIDHAVDALRETGESFLLNLTTSNGHAVEAMGRAIGGQAIVRICLALGVKRELAETNLRLKSVMEETEMAARALPVASPWPLWAKGVEGRLVYANAAYAEATEAATVDDAIDRNLELLDSGDRAEMEQALTAKAGFSGRLPIVARGERRIYDVRAINVGGGSVGIVIDASWGEADAPRLGAGADGGGASPHLLDQPASGVAVFDGRQRRLAFYNDPIAGSGVSILPSSRAIR